jgi:uncharacterized protein (UPF0332 family)
LIWGSLIALAGSLVGQESEAAKRSAVSRAYYGAFNAARRLLEAHGIPVDNHRAHDRVWRTFKEAGRATSGTERRWQMVGDLGGALRVLRNQADYADVVPRLDREAADAVATAQRLLTLLDELEFN